MFREEWKEYVLLETGKRYRISNRAIVVSLDKEGKEHHHTLYKNNGYRCIPYRKANGKNGLLYLHKIMAQLFVDNPNNYKKIAFKNGDSTNCQAHNLKWISREEAAYLNSKQVKPYHLNPNHAPNCKLGITRVSIIKKRIKENQKTNRTRWSVMAKQFDITTRHLWMIRTNKIWQNVEPKL